MKNTVLSFVAALFVLVAAVFAVGVDTNQTKISFGADNKVVDLSLTDSISGTGKVNLVNTLNSPVTVKFANTELVHESDSEQRVNLTVQSRTFSTQNESWSPELKLVSTKDIEAGKYTGKLQIVNESNPTQVFDEVFVDAYLGALEVKSIDVKDASSGSTDTKLEKGQKFTVDVEIENIADESDVEDLTVTVGVYTSDSFTELVENLEGDELEDDEDIDSLGKGKSKTVSFEFEMPYDMSDGEEFVILAEVTAKAEETSSTFYAKDTKDIEGSVADSKVEITKATMTPTLLSCGVNRARVSVELQNIGDNAEDVQLFLRNGATSFEKILFNGEDVELEDDFKDEDAFTETVDEVVTLTDLKEGQNTYSIVAYFDDGDKTVTEDVVVTLQSCSPTAPTTPSTPTGSNNNGNTNNDVVVIPTTPSTPTIPNVPTAPTTPYVTLKDVSGYSFDADWMVPTVIGVGGLVIGLAVALLVLPRR